MNPRRKGSRTPIEPARIDGISLLKGVLERSRRDVEEARSQTKKKDRFKPDLKFAISFAKHFGTELARVLDPLFPGIRSGEIPSKTARGMKRVDLSYSTAETGLALGLSFKSVHKGENEEGNARFIHNMKRNDEELRVEATSHHLRQPYAVLIAIVFLPFESCDDAETSSFARWVEYLWPLKGRSEPEDAPDRFELVFMSLYARDGSDLGFYEVGGPEPCPRKGRPEHLLSLEEFVRRLKEVYDRRNGNDFYFKGEEPQA
ncbi:MAG: hypothetical protein ACE15D_17105 [Candidatus Eisenbacteria bacterium]